MLTLRLKEREGVWAELDGNGQVKRRKGERQIEEGSLGALGEENCRDDDLSIGRRRHRCALMS